MDLAPGVDLVEIVLADESVDGESITESGTNCVVTDFFLKVACRLHLVVLEEHVSHHHGQNDRNHMVQVQIVSNRFQTRLVVHRQSTRQQLLQEFRQQLFQLTISEHLSLELKRTIPFKGSILY